MSDGAPLPSDVPHGLDLLPRDLSPAELSAAPVLTILDELLLDLTDAEDEAFAAALAP